MTALIFWAAWWMPQRPVPATAAVAHPFYVSVTQMHHRPGKQRLEISLRTFSDDLEQALQANGHPGHLLGSGQAPDSLRAGVADYITRRLTLSAGGDSLALTYHGFELGPDVTWHYLSAPLASGVKELRVCNRVFFGTLREQRNIVRFQVGEESLHALCTLEEACRRLAW
jgi:hypothetical protein